MPGVTFTKESLMESVKLEPGWYELTIKDFTEKLARDSQSMNFWLSLVVSGPKSVGTPIRVCFSEKMLSGFAAFIQCFTKDENELVGKEVIDLGKKTIGRKIRGYCKYNAEGFVGNTVEDWQPSQTQTAA